MNSLSANQFSEVFSYLDYPEVLKFAVLNKRALAGSKREYMWQEKARKLWLFNNLHKYGGSWRELFKHKKAANVGMLRGQASDYHMVPLRGHTSYITGLASEGIFIVSG